MKYNYSKELQKRRIPWLAFIPGIIFILFLLALVMSWRRWEGTSPEVRLDREFKTLGRHSSAFLLAHDTGSGLKRVSIVVKQEEQAMLLLEEEFARPDYGPKKYDLGKLILEKSTIREGPATVEISATDHSFRNFFRGNRTIVQHSFVFDTTPPILEVISRQHYINQGGSECVIYRVSPDAVTSGVRIGSLFFPGYDVPGEAGKLKFSLFAFPYHLDPSIVPHLIARDDAGNEATARFWYKVFARTFRNSTITIEDSFLEKVVPEILSHSPEIRHQGDLLKDFLAINGELRKSNHTVIQKLSEKSKQEFLWKGPFLQLSKSKVEASFADRRTYLYKGEVVDQQDHIGFDLSVVRQYPIEAANDGIVLYAGYFGIYGNAILIDHGYGLISLYGHLSSMDVKEGDVVKKKQKIGRSGETGLAAGDHLHFGLFLQGVPINPIEWWDDQWIQNHITLRLQPPPPAET